MFEVVMIGGLLFCFGFINRLWTMRRHDVVLFRLCDLRREAMTLLMDEEKVSNMQKSEYHALRQIIHVTSRTIGAYKNHKTVIFNLRRFIRELKRYECMNKRANTIPVTKHADIERIRHDLYSALAFGFITYTPFIHFEIFARFLIFILSGLSAMGMEILGKYAQALIEAKEEINKSHA